MRADDGTDGQPLAAAGADAVCVAGPRTEMALWAAREGVWDWDLITDKLVCSPRFREIFGVGSGTRCDSPADWYRHIHADDVAAFQAAIRLHVAGERPHFVHELRLAPAQEGADTWVQVRGAVIGDIGGSPVAMAGTAIDISARKQMEAQLAHDVFHDQMTGLANRVLLLDRVGHALDRSQRLPGRGFAVAIFDLDRFKKINDALGSQHGDEALRIVARRLLEERRLGDTLARLSADEFCVVLLDAATVEEAKRACTRMMERVAEPIDLGEHQLVLSCSVGIAMSTGGYERPEELLRDCGLAVYRAKQLGRARIDVFDGSLRQQAVINMRTETDLRAALEENQFCLFYQPIMCMTTDRIAGFEALIRWQHPVRGLVPPADFIPLAEETGLIIPMGRWVLSEASRQLAEWQQRFPRRLPMFMSVNVSFRQFSHDDLPTRVREVIAASGIAPRDLKLEITESLLMQDPKHSRKVMEELRGMGIGLSIDDFGTGYSSLSYLHKLPADSLKIDKSFVQAISTGGSNAAIVQVVTTLATILGMQAIAEGVENAEEADFLRDIMCRYAQGYFYSRPLPAGQIEEILAEQDRQEAAALVPAPLRVVAGNG